MGCHFLLQEIFPTQGSNPCLLRWQADSLLLSHQGSHLVVCCCCCCCQVAPVVSDSVRPHRWQPTRLPHPWYSPGKNTGVGCQFLLQCMKVKSEREVAQSCPTLSDPIDCSLPCIYLFRASQVALVVKNSPANAGVVREAGLIPRLGRSLKEAMQCSCLENPMDRGAWQAMVHRVAKSRTQQK